MRREEASPLLVIGVGNAWRHDDGAGPAVAERLAERVATLILPGEGTELLEAWREADRVIVVDAMQSGAPVGTVRRFDALEAPLPARSFPHLSHSFGLPEAVEMARLLGGLPRELTVFGIEAGDLSFGRGLGPDVADAVGRLAGEIMER
ncbi:hydrogenase maturation protease [Telmatospirillum siberiense]|uniref:Hydrogenase maturation protease n=1 Tax=Telmatospirillum siberiense TaxID=382514 RepID=A0A2N3PU41_9PROT|nr:hydrogenase maturation protease [Telmatospirillum siberiense]PKU23910.1 hydrogenase maturation protease [Telmatospirillum siberiense]